MLNVDTYLISSNLYTHPRHRQWLSEVKTDGLLRSLAKYENTLSGGWVMSKKSEEFAESKEYNHLVHELDIVSGEYVEVIKPHARKLIRKILDDKGIDYDIRDLKYTTNFSSSVEDTVENRRNRSHYDQGRYYFDAVGGEQISIDFEEAEAYAYA